jgi:hypothetical protein
MLPEPRVRPYREVCPRDLHDRLHLAATEPLVCMSFSRLDETSCHFLVQDPDSTFNSVFIEHIPTCTCNDFILRNDLCKHILYVNRFIIGLDASDPLCFQQAYTTSEIVRILQLVTSPIMVLL